MKRGELYIADLGPGVGDEVRGTRPVVLVSADIFNVAPRYLVVVPAVGATDIVARIGVPVSSAQSGYTVDIAVLAQQPLTVDPSRISGGPVGTVPPHVLQRISYLLAMQLDVLKVEIPET